MEGKRQARHWRREDGLLVCTLCPHMCRLTEGKTGICRGKQNIDGTLWATNYAEAPALAHDPIEKKPLFHFYPGSWILSLGPVGCNFKCSFCQNWIMSQHDYPTSRVDPEELVKVAVRSESIGISYTYTEPIIWFEFIYDCAKAFKEAGLKNVMVSNGYINPEPLADLLPLIDGWNIDLKSIRPDFYPRMTKGKLEPVLNTIVEAAKVSHVELTNLIIPGENDSESDLRELVSWVAGVDRRIPLHFSSFYPAFKIRRPPTPRKTMELAYEIGREQLDYVYVGNTYVKGTEATYCPGCGEAIVERVGFSTKRNAIRNGCCPVCGHEINIVS